MLGFALIPSIFLIVGALTMFSYSLDGPDWLVQKEEIIKIHVKKEEEYIEYLEKRREKKENRTKET
ncbi:MAG: hypothetical protein ACXAEX_08965, partial [Promethearchaeota archaeon]|jgi:hypothetical protein